MRISNHIVLTALLLCGGSFSLSAQVDPIWVNNNFSECKKSEASHYLLIEQMTDYYVIAMYDVSGNLKMKGGCLDPAGEVFDGEFEFYHSSGMVESKGRYMYDAKVGVWERFDQRGNRLAERNYASFDTRHMAYTYVDEMPKFEGGRKDFSSFLKQKMSPLVNETEFRDNGPKLELGFVVKEDGTIEGVEFIKGLDPDWNMRALHSIGALPTCIPGKKSGKEVRVYVRLPLDLSR